MQTNTPLAALVYLSSVCDGAADRDGAGFGAFDAEIGHDLARKGAQFGFSEKQFALAQKLAHKYRRQLAAAGFDPELIAQEVWMPSDKAPPAPAGYARPAKPIDGFPNRFAGRCGCGARVEAGHGRCAKQGGRWITYCGACAEPTPEADLAGEPMVRLRVVGPNGEALA